RSPRRCFTNRPVRSSSSGPTCRAPASASRTPSTSPETEDFMKPHALLARDLMTRPVRRLTSHASVRDAAEFLVRNGISGAPVEDEHGRWLGVFTMTDLAKAVAFSLGLMRTERTLEQREPVSPQAPPTLEDLGSLKVNELMTPGMVTVFPDATIGEVVK